MIKKNKVKCPICSGYLKRYDNVQRVVMGWNDIELER